MQYTTLTDPRAKYLAYLRSADWNLKRSQALGRAQGKCQLCSSDENLRVHHRTYANLYREAPADLTVLCDRCHRRFHDVGTEGWQSKGRRPAEERFRPSLPVTCPYCNAKAGNPCVRKSGVPRTRLHAARVRLAGSLDF